MQNRFNQFFNNIYILFRIYLFQLVLFTTFRIAFIIRLKGKDNFSEWQLDILNALMKGFQFDTMIICYGLLIPILLFLLNLFISTKRFTAFSKTFVKWYSGITLAIFLLVLFIDQFYYNYFQSHINVLIFGVIDDDTKAIMSSVWSDYPLIKILFVWCVLIGVYGIFIDRLVKKENFTFKASLWLSISGVLIVLSTFFIGLRQSFGTFPLQSHDATVSKNKSINFLVMNGVFALQTSIDERGKSENLEKSALGDLKEMGYTSPFQAAKDYFADENLSSILSDSVALEKLFHKTPVNQFLEDNKPNVIFIFMESMSNYNMSFDSERINLLGHLRKHFKSDILYKNFVSSGNATIQSLEYLMINTPIGITQSKYRFFSFPSATAIPFKKAGFTTRFITGGETSWRNLNEFVPNQGFQSMAGKQEILAEIKSAESNHWGVYDEYLFEYVFKKLSDKSSKPKFFFIQTTTNHTPFELPKNYKPAKISLTNEIKKRLLVSEDLAVKNLNCFQYSNNCLGTFLDKIKNSSLSKNTIVVMTGDHNNLMLFDFNESQQLKQRGVPLYMYIPEKYKPANAINSSHFGSHKDIFPTIYNIVLSNTRYYSIGNNLLESKQENRDKYFGLNIGSNTAFSKLAAVNYSNAPILYEMNNNEELVLNEESPYAKKLLKLSRSNYALSLFNILSVIKSTKIANDKFKIEINKPN